jgi:hypothetical protein
VFAGLQFLAVIVVGIPLLAASFRPTSQSSAQRWSDRHGLGSSGEVDPVTHRYLTRMRKSRALGAVFGVVASIVVPGGTIVGPLVLGGAGLVCGGIVGELAMRSSPKGDRRAASLRVRRSRDYVSDLLRVGLLAVTGITTGLGIWLGVAHGGISSLTAALGSTAKAIVRGPVRCADGVTRTFSSVPAGAGALLVLTAITVVSAVAAVAVVRLAIRRPQPWLEGGSVAADDAVRAASATTSVASALGLSLWATATLLLEWARRIATPCSPGPVRAVRVLALLAIAAAVMSWGWFARRSSVRTLGSSV